MTPYQKTHDTCEHGQRIKQENLYCMDIQNFLYSKGWIKLAYKSLWSHPTYGTWYILYAFYLSVRPIQKSKQPKFWWVGLGILVGSLMTFLIERLL